MFTLSDFQSAIEQQFLHNQNKSLFYMLADGRTVLSPSKQSTTLFKQKSKEMGDFLQSAKSDGTFHLLLKDVSEKTIQLFMEVNQYLDFNRDDHQKLQNIYRDLFEHVMIMGNQEEICDKEIDQLFHSHYKNLQAFLLGSNGSDIFQKYRQSPRLFEIKCAEYSPEFQMNILSIHLETLKEPVLDLGCGPQAHLVHFLRRHGIKAFGMDRNVDATDDFYKLNWLECDFTPNTWGTVISHMAFSNHFIHHHLKADGNFEMYARKYMEILKSLKLGGSFIYAPRLSFIEPLLSSNTSYIVEATVHSTKVKRVK